MKRVCLFFSLLVVFATTAMAQEGITISSGNNLSQTWTSTGVDDVDNPSYTPWGTDAIADYPSGITPTSGNEVHMATTENVTISELGRLEFTFRYTTGNHRLNILGVDLLSGEEVIASDYHKGQAGGVHSNNIYTFVAPAGTYTLRYFVEHNTSSNDLRRTNGNITATLTNADGLKTALSEKIESFRSVNMFEGVNVDDAKTRIANFEITDVDTYKALEQTYKNDLMATIDGKCFTFNSKGRSTTNGRYLGVAGVNLDGTMDIVATDANELKNIWKLEYVGENKFRLLNIAYDVYAKPIDSFNTNNTIKTTSSQENAGLYLINPQSSNIAFGDRENGDEQFFLHESNWSGHEILRWDATSEASQWSAVEVEEPELCSITYNYTLDGVNFRTEKLNVLKGSVYTFVNNYNTNTKVGMTLKSDIPAAATINEDQVVNYEYETELPFEPATISNNRLAEGSKLYKITLRGKSVQLNADGTDFEYNSNGAIENKLFALAGTALDDWQIFNYAAGLNKPIWSANNSNGTHFLPTENVTEKLELVNYEGNYSFKKKGTNYYLHDYGGSFAVWNDNTAYDDPGSYVTFTPATEKEVSIATLNLDIATATSYSTEELLDADIKTSLQDKIDEANTALTNDDSTAETLNAIDAELYRLIQDAANDLIVQNADGFKNNGVYQFVSSRGKLIYYADNPNVVASTKKYTAAENADRWSIHKSPNTGTIYMYNILSGKFVGGANVTNGQIPFTENPENGVLILAGTKSGYPIMIATNNSSVINHYDNDNAPGVANWYGGQSYTTDDGNCHMVTKVALLDDQILDNITKLVNAFEIAPQKAELLEKITWLTTFKNLLAEDEKTTVQTAIDEAQALYDSDAAEYTAVVGKITELNNLKKEVQYIRSTEDLSNDVCYTVATLDRGAWYSEDTHLNSTGKLGIDYNTSDTQQQFAFVKSPDTGNYYIYSVSENKFVSKSGDYTQLTDVPVETVTFLNSNGDTNYPWCIALNTQAGQKQIAVSNSYTYGIITFHNNLSDSGNRVRLERVATFAPETALAAISSFEIAQKKQELLQKINEANENSLKEYLPQDKRDGLIAAATTAQGVYESDATYDDVVEQIDIIADLLNNCVYVTTPDGFSNTAIYTIVSGNGAYVMYNETKTADYAISSLKYNDIDKGEAVAGCQWVLYESTSGNRYLYNVGAQKFLGTTTTSNGSIPLNANPTSKELLVKNSEVPEYPLMFSVNNGSGSLNHNSDYTYGLLNWNSGWSNLTGTNNIHKVKVVGALESETLATIEGLVNTFETASAKQELITLLDGIYSNYFDAHGTGNWRIGSGVNCYTQQDGDEDFVTAYTDARTYETSEDAGAIQTQIDRMNGLVENLTINQPVAGKYYRLRCTDGKKYLSSNVNNAGRLQMTSGTDGSNIFYYTGSGLISYAEGVYIHANYTSNHIKLRGVGETSTAEFVDGKDNNEPGSYLINIKNSDDAQTGCWIHGKNETSDSGQAKPSRGQEGYNWWLEEVTTLPVIVPATGYAAFYAPVALTVPASGVTAHTAIVEGNNAVLSEPLTVIPANKGVILYAEGITEDTTYNFSISDEVIEAETFLTGDVAASYVTDDAYILDVTDGLVSLNKATKDQQNSTAFLNRGHAAYMLASELTTDQQELDNYPIVTAAIGDAIDAFELQIESVQGKSLCVGTLVGQYTEPDDWFFTAMGIIGNINIVTSATTVDEINGWATQLQEISNSFIANLPVDGKAYTFKNVQPNGTLRWLKYDGSGMVLTAVEAEATVFVSRLLDSETGKYAFAINDGKYLRWRGQTSNVLNSEYNSTQDVIWVEKMSTGTYIEKDQSTTRHMALKGYRGGTGNNVYNYFVIKENSGNPSFDQANAQFYRLNHGGNGPFSSAFIIDEVEYSNKPILTEITDADELVTVNGSSIATFSAPFPTIVPDGVTAYVATTDGSDDVVYIEPIEGAIPANTGVILVGQESGEVIMKPAAGEAEATWEGENKFSHSAGAAKTMADGDGYILAKGNNGIGFYATSGGTLAMNKSYLAIAQGASFSIRIRTLGHTTEIDDVDVERGQVNAIYDLQGRKLDSIPGAGMYIVNGKKVLVK